MVIFMKLVSDIETRSLHHKHEVFKVCFSTRNLSWMSACHCDHIHPASVKHSLQTRPLSTLLHTEICMAAIQAKPFCAWIRLICHDNCSRVLINPLGILLRTKPTHCQGGVCCSALYAQSLERTRGCHWWFWVAVQAPFLKALYNNI